MSLANGLSILFILSKNQLLALLIFSMVSFVSFAFISALIFKISCLLLTLADGQQFRLQVFVPGGKEGFYVIRLPQSEHAPARGDGDLSHHVSWEAVKERGL